MARFGDAGKYMTISTIAICNDKIWDISGKVQSINGYVNQFYIFKTAIFAQCS